MERRKERRNGHGAKIAAAVVVAIVWAGAPAWAQSTTLGPSAAQPTLPPSSKAAGSSTVVESLVGKTQPALEVHKRPMHAVARRHTRRRVARTLVAPPDIARPALAGVELIAPLPRPGEPPHFVVPTPAYPLETLAASFLAPAPPIVCRDVRRDPSLPDPRLYRERTVACEPDNP